MNNHNALNIWRNPTELDKYAKVIAMQKLVYKMQYLDHFEALMNYSHTNSPLRTPAVLSHAMWMSVRMGFDLDAMRQMTDFHRSEIYKLDVNISESMATYTKLQPDACVQRSISRLQEYRDAHRSSVAALHTEMHMYAQ